jgi:hypothetical protein
MVGFTSSPGPSALSLNKQRQPDHVPLFTIQARALLGASESRRSKPGKRGLGTGENPESPELRQESRAPVVCPWQWPDRSQEARSSDCHRVLPPRPEVSGRSLAAQHCAQTVYSRSQLWSRDVDLRRSCTWPVGSWALRSSAERAERSTRVRVRLRVRLREGASRGPWAWWSSGLRLRLRHRGQNADLGCRRPPPQLGGR